MLPRSYLVLIVLVGLLLAGFSLNYLTTETELPIQRYVFDLSCDLRAGPCETQLSEENKVSFSVTPRSLPLLQPLQLEVRLQGGSAEKVVVDINGVGMNMGLNRVELQTQGNGLYRGNTSLSVCVRDLMAWEAKVLLRQTDRILEVPFRFITARDMHSVISN